MTTPSNTFHMLGNVTVSVSVELGRTELPLREVLTLGEESVVPLDRLTDELLDVMVNGRPIAKAEVITEGNKFALRIVEMLSDADNGRATPSAAKAPASIPGMPAEAGAGTEAA